MAERSSLVFVQTYKFLQSKGPHTPIISHIISSPSGYDIKLTFISPLRQISKIMSSDMATPSPLQSVDMGTLSFVRPLIAKAEVSMTLNTQLDQTHPFSPRSPSPSFSTSSACCLRTDGLFIILP